MTQHLAWPSSDSRQAMVQTRRQRWLYFACKRLFDICVAALLLVALSPLLLVIAALIILETPGPAIFRQKRVGLRRPAKGTRGSWQVGTFEFLKFRTMYHNADSDIHRAFVKAFIGDDREALAALQGGQNQVRKLTNDDRITPLGRFLRRSSLDELPQLWNVFKGDMSLVGPRPPLLYEVEMYEPWHCRRLGTTPGLTGAWQVWARSSVDFDEMVRLDIEYIESQSFWLDLKILLATPLAVIRGKGAA